MMKGKMRYATTRSLRGDTKGNNRARKRGRRKEPAKRTQRDRSSPAMLPLHTAIFLAICAVFLSESSNGCNVTHFHRLLSAFPKVTCHRSKSDQRKGKNERQQQIFSSHCTPSSV